MPVVKTDLSVQVGSDLRPRYAILQDTSSWSKEVIPTLQAAVVFPRLRYAVQCSRPDKRKNVDFIEGVYKNVSNIAGQ